MRWTGRLAALALALFAAGFLWFVGAVTSGANAPPLHADGIVALTGDEERIATATELLANGLGQRLLISGVNRHTTRAALERLTPQSHSLFNCCIDIGYDARDTIGNADETRDWVAARGFDSLIVVMSDYHMPRSLIELGRAMPGVLLIPHATPSRHLNRPLWWTSTETTRVLLAEYIKILPATARLAVSRIFPPRVSETAGRDRPYRASTL